LTTITTSEISQTKGQGETVLLAEDDNALREAISAFLSLHGYKVLEAGDGTQAMAIAKQHAESIRVLVTDVILPKLGGGELAREVAKISPQAAILYMSGYPDRGLVDYDPASSTVGFLQKPFALQALLQKLREMIMARA
jgi:DNA-binding NtrC family response regulator